MSVHSPNADRPVLDRPTVAVVGAGLAGAACASRLQAAGYDVTVFDKSRGVGGRLATRRLRWLDADGSDHWAEFDHGAPFCQASDPAFRGWLAGAESAGVVRRWRPRVHAPWSPGPANPVVFVPQPTMPALVRYALAAAPVRHDAMVERLQRSAAGWSLCIAGGDVLGPYDRVLLAVPPAQAAALLDGLTARWAGSCAAALAAVHMAPCWTLLAITDERDWPWDAAEPDRGPLAWVARNDRRPGRSGLAGYAFWVAQARAEWSAEHLEAEPAFVADDLRRALAGCLPDAAGLRWHHASVHRWRYAVSARAQAPHAACHYDPERGLGWCGDHFTPAGSHGAEAAWLSGQALAEAVLEVRAAPERAALRCGRGTGAGTRQGTPVRAIL